MASVAQHDGGEAAAAGRGKGCELEGRAVHAPLPWAKDFCDPRPNAGGVNARCGPARGCASAVGEDLGLEVGAENFLEHREDAFSASSGWTRRADSAG